MYPRRKKSKAVKSGDLASHAIGPLLPIQPLHFFLFCIIRTIRSRRMHVARMGAMRNVYKIFIGKPEGKIPLGIANDT
jgi:hypothetical protein